MVLVSMTFSTPLVKDIFGYPSEMYCIYAVTFNLNKTVHRPAAGCASGIKNGDMYVAASMLQI